MQAFEVGAGAADFKVRTKQKEKNEVASRQSAAAREGLLGVEVGTETADFNLQPRMLLGRASHTDAAAAAAR